MSDKIIEYNRVAELIPKLSGKKVVLCGGCFDIFHYGHLMFLKSAKMAGDVLCVQVESDDFIKLRKKRVPVHNQMQRTEIIASLEFVDYVIALPLLTKDEEYGNLVTLIHPSVVAVTQGDAAIDKKQRHAGIIGAEVREVCAPFHSFSSSNIGKYEGIFSD